MTITKNESVYTVQENKKSWTLLRAVDRVKLRVTVDKTICRTFEELRKYVAENDLF